MVNGKGNSYSAVVLSMNAEVYQIDTAKFAAKFPNILPDLAEIVDMRNIFIVDRLKKQAKFHFMMNYLQNRKQSNPKQKSKVTKTRSNIQSPVSKNAPSLSLAKSVLPILTSSNVTTTNKFIKEEEAHHHY